MDGWMEGQGRLEQKMGTKTKKVEVVVMKKAQTNPHKQLLLPRKGYCAHVHRAKVKVPKYHRQEGNKQEWWLSAREACGVLLTLICLHAFLISWTWLWLGQGKRCLFIDTDGRLSKHDDTKYVTK